MFLVRSVQLLLLCSLLSSCADNDFFQEDALVQEKHPEGITDADSVWVVAGRHYDRNGFHRFFWGDHHRATWNTPVKAKVFKLSEVKGGLKVDKLGGGYQTVSFELEDSLGREYAFRSIDKDPVHVLYDFWKPTFVTNILRDQTSAANPYGALVVPALAEAAGIPHTNPELYYVPLNDTSFGVHSPLVQGKLFLLEEKFKTPVDLTYKFKNASDFVGSEDALRQRFSSNKYRFDQEAFAKARLLDILLGDWDRHKGQWDWAVVQQEQETTFKPIPKDRDQVFFKMDDGVIPFIATSRLMARKFETFGDKISDVKALMINSAFEDERLLNELTREDFQVIAKQVQQALTDKVIQQAVAALPQPVYQKIGQELEHSLKSRRAQLPEAADKMYRILAEKVTVVGSDEKEIFQVKRLDDNRTEVVVSTPEDATKQSLVRYSRIFYREETNEIILHGLAGDDEFIVEGAVDKGILIKIYGGLGEDKIIDRSKVAGLKKYTHIFDTDRGNKIEFGTESKDRTTDNVKVHAFDREGN